MAKIKGQIVKMAIEKAIEKLASNAIRETNQWIENSSPFPTDTKRNIRASEFRNKVGSGLDYGYNHP